MNVINLDLSVIIVNYNSSKYLDECIRSIIDNTQGISYEIIVVDNASFDGCDLVVKKYPGVAILIQSGKNLGFARANNLGYQQSRGRALLILNPDTEIIGDTLNKLYRSLISLENVGCLGCTVLNEDKSIQTSCIQSFPTITNQLLDAECLRNLFPKLRLWGIRPLYEKGDMVSEVEAIAGSCMMVLRETFEKVGLFSEEYFMYSEDIDLCYKMGRLGYRNYYTGRASIIHYGGKSTKSTGKSSFSPVLIRDSMQIFLRKSRGNVYSVLFAFSIQIASLLRIFLILVVYPITFFNILDKNKLKNSLSKWKSIFLWSIGREERVNNIKK